jgi:hypothetical protein
MRRFLLRAACAARLTEASFGGDLAGRFLPDVDQATPGQLKERL